MYKEAIRKAAQTAAAYGTSAAGGKLPPIVSNLVDELLGDLNGNIYTATVNSINKSWLLNDEKWQMIIDKNYKTFIDSGKYDMEIDSNEAALRKFITRKEDSKTLSDRVWSSVQPYRQELETGLKLGVANGKPAAEMARDLTRYLKDPDGLYRRVRNEHNELLPSKAMANRHPGRGVYKSSFKNSMRVTRTETNMAYRMADMDRYQNLDFVLGYEIRLSNNHPVYDICDECAGKYPKSFVFRGWHPQCRCHSVPILMNEGEFDELENATLDGKPAPKSDNLVTDVPDGFKQWVDEHKDQVAKYKSTPYWVKDNFKKGKISDDLKFATQPNKEKAIKINRPIKSASDVHAVLKDYSAIYPEDFARGFKSFTRSPNQSYLLETDGSGRIRVNDRTFKVEGNVINPYQDLISAFNKIKNKVDLTFNEEYAIEGLYHEILHNKAKGLEHLPSHAASFKRTAMEIANQFVARHDYARFIDRIGGTAINQSAILDKGYGYRGWISRFRDIIKKTGADESDILVKLRPILLEKPYGNIENELFKIVKDMTGLSFIESVRLAKGIYNMNESQFIDALNDIK
ncbi:hypothetical protein [Hufsiella ginkgonis]|uniref:Phage head morphogenesis domain-containing protein n=1 Tax=Hufsiella ginkgonis TaxID=2695274 RepID=A0A7K1Y0S4_9SPHI|nr:hypothetical protein [Hufsiella ginkgonis]MXV16843.1 hypothetical protein [Hufsiella ginkgonis]